MKLDRLRADAATWTFRAVLAITVVVFWRVGRRQWFIRDDWAFLLTRPLMHEREGIGSWLFTGQDGHWMTIPLLIERGIQNVFGLGSYWPFLVPTMALHVATVLLVRALLRRHQVSAWTTTALCSVLLLFGAGWEDIAFAVQLVYNLSLVAFLAHVLLVDHDGPPDARDVVGALLGIVSVMSSGFGPFFAFGVALLLVARRRWTAAAIAVVPQALAFAWWWLAWGSDSADTAAVHSIRSTITYVRLGITATVHGLAGELLLGGAAAVGIVAVLCWPGMAWSRRRVPAVLAVVVLVTYAGIGWERSGLGVGTAEASRYVYVAAMLLVPALALAVDQVARYHRYALPVVLVVFAASTVRNARLLVRSGDDWGARAHAAGRLFALVAGTPEAATADPGLIIETFNPDVRVGSLPLLVAEGTITPRVPATDGERVLVAQVLAGHPVDTDALRHGVAVPAVPSP